MSPGLPSGVGGTVMSVAMAPIEIIGKLVKPFALAVRLFGNMTAGHFVILSLLRDHLPVRPPLGLELGDRRRSPRCWCSAIMVLELFVAFLQAYVFALLRAVFIGLMQHEH